MNELSRTKKIVIGIIIGIFAVLVSYGITCAFVYAICWCFDLPFSFKFPLGLWLIEVGINFWIREVKIKKEY